MVLGKVTSGPFLRSGLIYRINYPKFPSENPPAEPEPLLTTTGTGTGTAGGRQETSSSSSGNTRGRDAAIVGRSELHFFGDLARVGGRRALVFR